MVRVAIIGAGIGGLGAAQFLRQAGFEVTVYEQAARSEAIGAGIVVPPNMVKLLDRLGLAENLDTFAVPLQAAWEFRRWEDGRILSSQPMGENCIRLYGANCYVAHRAELIRHLTRDLPVSLVRFDHKCVAIREDENGVQLSFVIRDGSKILANADVVIGADGIHSRVKQDVVPDVDPRFSGLCAFRCLVPADKAPEMARKPVHTIWRGPERHFVHYPVSAGKLVNVVAIVPAGNWRKESWTDDGTIADLMQEFADWDDRLRQLITSAVEKKRWALYDRDPLPRWTKGRLALLGDAAHPTLPFFAQGAAQALEDGCVLAACLQGSTVDSVHNALQSYERLRAPRANHILLMSRGRQVRNHLPDGPEQAARDHELASSQPLRQSAYLYGEEPTTAPPIE